MAEFVAAETGPLLMLDPTRSSNHSKRSFKETIRTDFVQSVIDGVVGAILGSAMLAATLAFRKLRRQ